MSDDQEEYIAVLKASFDYTPQSEDEIEIKEDQLLLLIEKTDDDWWKVKSKGDSDGQGGLVPSAYVESAEHSSVMKVQYDYDAAAQGELSLKEDQTLLVFGDEEDGWLLVQEKDGGKVGYVPGNYVEVVDAAAVAATPTSAPSTAPHIVIPDSPPRPTPPVYVDPAERVRSTASKAKADVIKTWAISEIDKRGKKKKGTLGIGNGAIFFASEADKTPVQKWQINDVMSAVSEKPKHVLIEVGGAAAANLHFHAGSKDTAEEILVKLESSRSLARESTEAAPSQAELEPEPEPEPAPAPVQRNLPPPIRTDGAHSPGKKGVHFSEASPAIIPPRSASPEARQDEIEGLESVALYDFQAQGEDELSVAEGDALWIIEQEGDEWWKCRNMSGGEGVVPASYVEPTGGGRLPQSHMPPYVEQTEEQDNGSAEREAEERAAAERAGQEAKEAREREEKEQRARAVAVAAEAEQRRKDKERRDREEREREERERREKKREEEGAEEDARREKRAKSSAKARSSKSSSEGRKSNERRAPPDPSQTREWRDRTGQFRVEAAFLGYKNGVLRLHKVNGVVIEVAAEKMSVEDIRHAEKIMGRGGSTSRKADDDDDDDEPLGKRQQSAQTAAAPQKKAPPIDWFEFFLNAGCDVDDCTRYASSFERDKIDESILPDISEGTLRTLGLREGDIIRVNKAIDARRPIPAIKAASPDINLLGGDEASSSARTTPSPGPPNLFTGPGGQLKSARRGRPTPSKSGSTAPGSVDLDAISTASEQIARSTTPLVVSPTAAPTIPTATIPQVQSPPRSNSAATSGFDDDAWTNRPSSTKPVTPTPPSLERVPSVPPLPGALPITSSAPTPPQPARAPSAPVTSTGANAGGGLAKTTEADIFDQLSRLTQLRVQNPAPAVAPRPSPGPAPPPSITNPLPTGYNRGMGVGSSPSPLGQHLQAQQTGLLPPGLLPPAQSGARGPFAPVPANQGLLAPLVPTSTGFSGFVPTRPATSPSFLGPQPTGIPQSSPLALQPTGFQPSIAPQPTGFQPSLVPQPTGFQPALAPQPTGFQPSLAPQPTGFQPSLAPQPTGFGGVGSPFGGGSAPFVPPVPPLPSSFQNGSFGQLQPQPTGFNPNFGHPSFSNGITQSISLPSPAAAGPAQKDTNPANVFASMKAGTFANDSAPQSSDKYDALRVTPSPLSAQPTGWGYPGFPGGYSGF